MTVFNQIGADKTFGAYDYQNPAPLRTYALDDGGFAVVQNFVVRYFDAFGSTVGDPVDLNPRPTNDGSPFPRVRVPVDVAVLSDGSFVFGSSMTTQYGTSVSYSRIDRDGVIGEGRGIGYVTNSSPTPPSVVTEDGRVVLVESRSGNVGREIVVTIGDTTTGQKLERVLDGNAGGQPRGWDAIDIGGGRIVASWLPETSNFVAKARIIDSVGNMSAVLEFGQNAPKFFDTEAGFGTIQSIRTYEKNQFVFKFFDEGGGLVREFTTSDGLRLPSGGRDNSLNEIPLDVDVLGDGSLLVVSAGSTSDSYINPRVYTFDQNGVAKAPPIALPFSSSLDARAVELENGDVFMSYLTTEGGQTGYKAKLYDVVYTEAGTSRALDATTNQTIDLGVGTDHAVYAANRAGFEVFTPDGRGNGAEIVRLYDAFLGRAPDAGGYTFWVGQLNAGQSLQDIARSFAASGEFQTQWANLTDRAFVEQIYERVLDRTGDKGGVDYWTGRVASDGRAAVLLEIARSEEAETPFRNEAVVRAPHGSFDRLENPERGVFGDGIVALDGAARAEAARLACSTTGASTARPIVAASRSGPASSTRAWRSRTSRRASSPRRKART